MARMHGHKLTGQALLRNPSARSESAHGRRAVTRTHTRGFQSRRSPGQCWLAQSAHAGAGRGCGLVGGRGGTLCGERGRLAGTGGLG